MLLVVLHCNFRSRGAENFPFRTDSALFDHFGRGGKPERPLERDWLARLDNTRRKAYIGMSLIQIQSLLKTVSLEPILEIMKL